MPKRVTSRKFLFPSLKGENHTASDTVSEEESISDKSEEMKLKAKVSRLLPNSQCEDYVSPVSTKTQVDSEGKLPNAHHPGEEDEVAIPEPNAALSPAESAEQGPSESSGNVVGTGVKTPDQRIDNSVLPPIRRKKPVSKVAQFKLKVRPTKLNFDDPSLMGKPDNLSKPKKSKSLHSKTSQKPKTSTKPSDFIDLKRINKPDTKKKNCPLTPDMRGGQQNEFRTPTGRVLNDSQLSTGSIGRGGAYLTPNSSQILCSQSSSVQMMALSPRSRLFRLQRKRNVGLWVQCANKNCIKWRYLPSTRDPTEVPDNWQCYMNHDKKYASCSAPEKGPTPVEEEDLIHNQYTAGSVVWGHLAGYPWWPAMVDDDPDVEQYYWITETCDIPTHYNVTFFDDKPVTRAWLTPGAMTTYFQPGRNKDLFKMSAHGTDYSRRLEVATRQADEALKLPIDERLKKFSFVARFKGPIGKKRYPSDSEDDVVETPSKRAGKVSRKDNPVSEEDPMMDFVEPFETVKEVNQVLNELISQSEPENGEQSEKGLSRPKHLVKNKKKEVSHAKRIKDRKHEDDQKKEMKEKKKKMKKKEKTSDAEKGEANEENKNCEKDKQDEINNLELMEKNNKQCFRKTKKNKERKDKNKDEAVKVNKRNEEIKKNKVTKKKVAVNLQLEQNKNDGKAVKGKEFQPKKSLKKNRNGSRPETNEYDGQLSSHKIGEKKKAKKKNLERVQNEANNSEIMKSESHGDASTIEHNGDGQVQVVIDEECASVERNDEAIAPETSDEEESPNEEDSKSDNEADEGKKEGEANSSEEGMDTNNQISASSEDDESGEDESEEDEPEEDDPEEDEPEDNEARAKPSPIPGISCGRSSADLFEDQQCNAGHVSASSQRSADFDIEE